jgi:hypothetical protein
MKAIQTKIILTTFLLLVFNLPSAHANQWLSCYLKGWSTQARVAYFSPSSSRQREIYSAHWVDYQFELARKIAQNMEIWSSVGFIQRDGESTFLKEHTRFRVVPFGLGFKYYYPTTCWSWKPYAGVGFNYRHLTIHNSSDEVKEHISQWKFGSTFKLGVKKECCNGIFYDLFIDYILQNFRFSGTSDYPIKRNDVYFNGWKIGAGIGYAF